MIKTYENLCQMLEKEICSIEQQAAKGFTKDSIELLKCLTEALDNLKELIDKENNMDRGMSNYMPHYDMSGAQRRDSMGRYMDNSYDRGYSRDDSRKKMVRKLETLMDDTMSENERNAIKDCISKIE